MRHSLPEPHCSAVGIHDLLYHEEEETAVFLCSGSEDPVILLSESGDYTSTVVVGGNICIGA